LRRVWFYCVHWASNRVLRKFMENPIFRSARERFAPAWAVGQCGPWPIFKARCWPSKHGLMSKATNNSSARQYNCNHTRPTHDHFLLVVSICRRI
jgi:hypothetical protein